MTARVLCLVLLGCCLAAVVTAGAAGCEVDTSAGKVLRTTVGMAGVFSTAAVVGDNVFLSGVLGLTNSTTTQPPVGRQTSLALSRLSHSLDYLFFSFLRCPREEYRRVEEHIYKLTVHVKDAESVAEVEAVIRRFFDTPPAYTIVSAVSLPFGAAVQLDCEVSLRKARKADTEGSTPLSLVRIQDHPPLNRIVTSGTLGTVGTPGGVGAETTQALQNVFAALNRTGEEAVVTQCIVHLRDNDRATFDTMNQAYAAFFPKVVPTRMSLSGVKLHQGAAVQVQCDAVEGGEKTITWGNVAGVAGLPVFSTFARSEPDQVLLLSGILGTLNNTVPFKLASGGITGETQQAMDNIKYSISRVVWGVDSHPAAMDRVAKCIVYLKASDMATVEAMSQVYTSYFSATPPATTLLLNVTLALGASVEVQCVASGQPEPSSWVSTATDIY